MDVWGKPTMLSVRSFWHLIISISIPIIPKLGSGGLLKFCPVTDHKWAAARSWMAGLLWRPCAWQVYKIRQRMICWVCVCLFHLNFEAPGATSFSATPSASHMYNKGLEEKLDDCPNAQCKHTGAPSQSYTCVSCLIESVCPSLFILHNHHCYGLSRWFSYQYVISLSKGSFVRLCCFGVSPVFPRLAFNSSAVFPRAKASGWAKKLDISSSWLDTGSPSRPWIKMEGSS